MMISINIQYNGLDVYYRVCRVCAFRWFSEEYYYRCHFQSSLDSFRKSITNTDIVPFRPRLVAKNRKTPFGEGGTFAARK